MLLLTALDQITDSRRFYAAFSHNRKRSKGRKNKLEGRMRPAGRPLAMSVLAFRVQKCAVRYDHLQTALTE
jgi:hypothetical protein